MNKKIGLTSNEVEILKKQFGQNEILIQKPFSKLKKILHFFSDPMGLMMLTLSVLYFITNQTADAIIILIAYIPITAVDVVLSFRANQALQSLNENLQLFTKTYRDNQIKNVSIKDLVPGDVILFEEGQKLPADGIIIEGNNLLINESALTGESLPIEKKINDSFLSGTQVLSGDGLGLIKFISNKTEYGKISDLIKNTDSTSTPLQLIINSIIKKILFFAILLVIFLFFLEFYRNSNIIKSLMTSLTFGMAAIPEEFPLVFTLYLTLGAWRLSKHGVLVKSLPSVEALGHIDVICTDKTGTLTQGKFSLIEVIPYKTTLIEEIKILSFLACEQHIVDPLEISISHYFDDFKNLPKEEWHFEIDYPFDIENKYMSHIWRKKNQQTSILAAKGSIEGLLKKCKLSTHEVSEINQKVELLSSQGHRLLGLAALESNFTGHRQHDENELIFKALYVFSDPIRPTARIAINQCLQSDIEIKMLTGDHPLTASSIAQQLGIPQSVETTFTGSQFNQMSEVDKKNAYSTGTIFARVTPEQKYQIVKHLKNESKIVAMTGDGINDTPALKLADIGVSMGENATDAARSTAKILLLNNNFNGLVQAIFEGRRIFTNLQKSFSYLISFHIPILILSFVPTLVGVSDFLLPIHIILLELIVHPISAFAFENLPSQNNKKNKSLITRQILINSIFAGLLLSLLSLSFLFSYKNEISIEKIRSLSLATFIFGNIGLVLAQTFPTFNFRIICITIILLSTPFLISNLSFINEYFHLQPLLFNEFSITLFLGMLGSLSHIILQKLILIFNSSTGRSR